MDIRKRVMRSSSPGVNKVVIIVLVVIVAGGVFVLSKFGPVYNDKWGLEDFMEHTIGRLRSLGEEGIMQDIDKYCKGQNIPIDPYHQCKFKGDFGKPGTITCKYKVEIMFPGMKEPYVHHMTAKGHRTKIPMDSD